MNFVVSICFNVLVIIINYIHIYIYICIHICIYIYMFYLYVVVSSLTYINPIKPSLDNCSPSWFHLRSFLLLGPHGRPMRLGARHLCRWIFIPGRSGQSYFHLWENHGKSITMADSNDPIPYIPPNSHELNRTKQ